MSNISKCSDKIINYLTADEKSRLFIFLLKFYKCLLEMRICPILWHTIRKINTPQERTSVKQSKEIQNKLEPLIKVEQK